MSLNFRVAHGDSIGKRENQEDFAVVVDAETLEPSSGSGARLLVLADGMGGHAAGEIASQSVCRGFVEGFGKSDSPMHERLLSGLYAANSAIEADIEENPDHDGMGSTVIGFFCDGTDLWWVSVGDSLLYLIRGDEMIRLNADHSYGAVLDEQAEEGGISIEEARNHPQRGLLYSAVMGEPLELVDIAEKAVKLQSGDVVIAASDGIETLNPEFVLQTVIEVRDEEDPDEILDRLFDAVKTVDRPGQDNTTIISLIVL